MVILAKRKPKIWILPNDVEEEDAGIVPVLTDRIPSVLIVRWFDMFCFGFAMCSYVLDFFSDIGVAILHFVAGRYVSAALILTFALFPSIIINVISMIWMLDDEMHWKRRAHPRRTGTIELDQKRFISVAKMSLLCVFQMGPLFWYYKALYYGGLFRSSEKSDNDNQKRRYFMKMVEAERDATWLRFYEAFLESAPQMIIQGSIASKFFLTHYQDPQLPFWLYFQAGSLLLSLISISWSVVVQNRSLRMIRDDKVNIWPHEAILQFCWRFLTIVSRMMTLSAGVVAFGMYMIPIISCHLMLTFVHVVLLQAIHIENCTNVEKLLLLVNSFIHIFTPFNMAEGRTIYRYLAAYSIEFIELLLVFYIFPSQSLLDHPYFEYVRVGVPIAFLTGIAIMILYYKFFHPNRRQFVATPSQFDLNKDLKEDLTRSTRTTDAVESTEEDVTISPTGLIQIEDEQADFERTVREQDRNEENGETEETCHN